jgi:single-stranded-DNA-specific exonuclease
MVDDAEVAIAARALAQVDASPAAALCLFDDSWHPGVVGLVASKMKERLHRPVIAFAPSEPGSDSLRGSARSIPGFHIRDALAAVDALHPGMIPRFGGHAMAAGLTLAAADLPAFEAAFRAHAERLLDATLLQAEIASDGELLAHEFDRLHAETLRDGGPWGQGFPEPMFDGEFDLVGWRVVGERHLKLELALGTQRLNAIQFGGWDGEPPVGRVRIAYRLATDDYRGGDAIQLIVEHREANPQR